MANDIQGWMRPKFSWHLSYSWGKTPEKSQPAKLNWLGIDSGLLGERQRYYLSTTVVAPCSWEANSLIRSFNSDCEIKWVSLDSINSELESGVKKVPTLKEEFDSSFKVHFSGCLGTGIWRESLCLIGLMAEGIFGYIRVCVYFSKAWNFR